MCAGLLAPPTSTLGVALVAAALGALELLRERSLANPINEITAAPEGTVPSGATVQVDVRGRTGSGNWTPWRTASGKGALLGRPVTVVQARVTLWDNTAGASPALHTLRLTAQQTAAPAPPTRHPAAYQVYATREGLVGGTTANGHVIQPGDHFVALPSGTAQVQLRTPGTRVAQKPVRCPVARLLVLGFDNALVSA